MVEFQVERMRCGGCANGVRKSIQALDGEARVEVDLARKTVRVESGCEISALQAAIDGAGYPVTACTVV